MTPDRASPDSGADAESLAVSRVLIAAAALLLVVPSIVPATGQLVGSPAAPAGASPDRANSADRAATLPADPQASQPPAQETDESPSPADQPSLESDGDTETASKPGQASAWRYFEENEGQGPDEAAFIVRGTDRPTYLTEHGTIVTSVPQADGSAQTVRVGFASPNPDAELEGVGEPTGRSNHLEGDDRSEWVYGADHYEELVLKDLYGNIDLRFYFTEEGRLKHDLELAAGEDPRLIRYEVDGADDVSVDDDGALALAVGQQTLHLRAPQVYQPTEDGRETVDGAYAIHDDGTIGYELGDLDPSRPIVIDPSLAYSTYLNGPGGWNGNRTTIQAVAVTGDGRAVVAGHTENPDFPTTADAQFNTTSNPNGTYDVRDGFVAVLSADGSSLAFSTFLTGNSGDVVEDMHLIDEDPVVAAVTGWTTSADFPTTSDASQPDNGSLDNTTGVDGREAFATLVPLDGSELEYSTYYGDQPTTDANATRDEGQAIHVDENGNILVAGVTESPDLATNASKAVDDTLNGTSDAFLAQFDRGTGEREYATYLGGEGNDQATTVTSTGAGQAIVAGSTASSDVNTTAGVLDASYDGDDDPFAAKIDTADGTRDWTTYLPDGSADAEVLDADVNATGTLFFGGFTENEDLPTPDGIQSQLPGSRSAFVWSLNPDATSQPFATYHGGGDQGKGRDIHVQGSTVHLFGHTTSTDLPLEDPVDATAEAERQAPFVASIDANTSTLAFGTYFGPDTETSDFGTTAHSQALSGALGPNGGLYLGGYTLNAAFPTTKDALHETDPGPKDGFLTKIQPAAFTSIPSNACSRSLPTSETSTVTFELTASDPDATNLTLTLDGDDVPANASVSPSGPVNGTAPTKNVTWSPSASQIGTHDLTFVATDAQGHRSTCEVTVLVSSHSLGYSTYLNGPAAGGNNDTFVDAVEVASDGRAVVAGSTENGDFPTTENAQQPQSPDEDTETDTDGFVAVLSPDGSSIEFATYLGGNQTDHITDLQLLEEDPPVAAVTGETRSPDFPTTENAADDANPGIVDENEVDRETDAFATLVPLDGSALEYSTYYGARNDGQDDGDRHEETGRAIHVDGDAIFIAGQTNSPLLPLNNSTALDDTLNEGEDTSPDDGFLAQFDRETGEREFATYLGGSRSESINTVTTTPTGQAIVAGTTSSSGFNTTEGVVKANGGGSFDDDVFATKIDPRNHTHVWSTYLPNGTDADDPGTDYENVFDVEITESGRIVLAGRTASHGMPTPGGIQSELHGTSSAFVWTLNPNATEVPFATYYGGSGYDVAYGGEINGSTYHLFGETRSSDLPLEHPRKDRPSADHRQGAFVATIDAGASSLEFGTYFGGADRDVIIDAALGQPGELYIAGWAGSEDFPTTDEAFQQTNRSAFDGFVTKLQADPPPTFASSPPAVCQDGLVGSVSSTISFDVNATDPTGSNVELSHDASEVPEGASLEPETNATGTEASKSFAWDPGLEEAGTYNLMFTARDEGGHRSFCEVTITVFGREGPDLEPANLTVGPTVERGLLPAGRTGSVELDVENTGEVDLHADATTVLVRATDGNGTTLAEKRLPIDRPIAAGGFFPVQTAFEIPQPGTNLTVEAVTDPAGDVPEASEANNRSQVETGVAEARPDLTIGSMGISGHASPVEGETIQVQAVGQNQGGLGADDARVEYDVSGPGNPPGPIVRDLGHLGPHGGLARDYAEFTLEEPGTYELQAEALPVALENATGNNAAALTIQVDPFEISGPTSFETGPPAVATSGVDQYASVTWQANGTSDVEVDIDTPPELRLASSDGATVTTHEGETGYSFSLLNQAQLPGTYPVNVTITNTQNRSEKLHINGTSKWTPKNVELKHDVSRNVSTDDATQHVELPVYDHPSRSSPVTGDLELDVTGSMGAPGRVIGGVGSLFTYPYGCVEQTASPTIGAVFSTVYADSQNVTSFDQATACDKMQTGIDRLTTGKRSPNPDGGWDLWATGGDSKPTFTAYGLGGLSHALYMDQIFGLGSHPCTQTANLASDPTVDSVVEDAALFLVDNATVNATAGTAHLDATNYGRTPLSGTGEALWAIGAAQPGWTDASRSSDIVTRSEQFGRYLLDNQLEDGGWPGRVGGSTLAAEATGQIMAGLAGLHGLTDNATLADRIDEAFRNATAQLEQTQQPDGSWDTPIVGRFSETGQGAGATGIVLYGLDRARDVIGESNVSQPSLDEGITFLVNTHDQQGAWGYTRSNALAVLGLTTTDETASGNATVSLEVPATGYSSTFDLDQSDPQGDQRVSIPIGDVLEGAPSPPTEDTLDVYLNHTSGDSVSLHAVLTQFVHKPEALDPANGIPRDAIDPIAEDFRVSGAPDGPVNEGRDVDVDLTVDVDEPLFAPILNVTWPDGLSYVSADTSQRGNDTIQSVDEDLANNTVRLFRDDVQDSWDVPLTFTAEKPGDHVVNATISAMYDPGLQNFTEVSVDVREPLTVDRPGNVEAFQTADPDAAGNVSLTLDVDQLDEPVGLSVPAGTALDVTWNGCPDRANAPLVVEPQGVNVTPNVVSAQPGSTNLTIDNGEQAWTFAALRAPAGFADENATNTCNGEPIRTKLVDDDEATLGFPAPKPTTTATVTDPDADALSPGTDILSVATGTANGTAWFDVRTNGTVPAETTLTSTIGATDVEAAWNTSDPNVTHVWFEDERAIVGVDASSFEGSPSVVLEAAASPGDSVVVGSASLEFQDLRVITNGEGTTQLAVDVLNNGTAPATADVNVTLDGQQVHLSDTFTPGETTTATALLISENPTPYRPETIVTLAGTEVLNGTTNVTQPSLEELGLVRSPSGDLTADVDVVNRGNASATANLVVTVNGTHHIEETTLAADQTTSKSLELGAGLTKDSYETALAFGTIGFFTGTRNVTGETLEDGQATSDLTFQDVRLVRQEAGNLTAEVDVLNEGAAPGSAELTVAVNGTQRSTTRDVPVDATRTATLNFGGGLPASTYDVVVTLNGTEVFDDSANVTTPSTGEGSGGGGGGGGGETDEPSPEEAPPGRTRAVSDPIDAAPGQSVTVDANLPEDARSVQVDFDDGCSECSLVVETGATPPPDAAPAPEGTSVANWLTLEVRGEDDELRDDDVESGLVTFELAAAELGDADPGQVVVMRESSGFQPQTTRLVSLATADPLVFEAELNGFSNFAVAVDESPPEVAPLGPANGTTIETGALTLSAAFSDNRGVDASTVELRLDGENQPVNVSQGEVQADIGEVQAGQHEIEVEVTDTSGLTTTETWTFTASEPLEPAGASPEETSEDASSEETEPAGTEETGQEEGGTSTALLAVLAVIVGGVAVAFALNRHLK